MLANLLKRLLGIAPKQTPPQETQSSPLLDSDLALSRTVIESPAPTSNVETETLQPSDPPPSNPKSKKQKEQERIAAAVATHDFVDGVCKLCALDEQLIRESKIICEGRDVHQLRQEFEEQEIATHQFVDGVCKLCSRDEDTIRQYKWRCDKGYWKQWRIEAANRAASEQLSPYELIKNLLMRSRGANEFRSLLKQAGFRLIDENVLGATFERGNCRIIYAVIPSYGSDAIFACNMKIGDEPTVCLVDEGYRNF